MHPKASVIILLLSQLIATCLLSTFAFAQSAFVRLEWSPNTEADLSHYVLYRDTEPGTMIQYQRIPASDYLFNDSDIALGTIYYYKLTAVDSAENESEPSEEVMVMTGLLTDSADDNDNIVREYQLKQNYPNPFNPTTTIEYSLPEANDIQIAVFNILGNKIKTLFAGYQAAGSHALTWDGRDDRGRKVTSGVYFYQMMAGSFNQVKKLVLEK